MPITRAFLGIEAPALVATVGYLVHRFGGPGCLDLREVLLVVPGARAGRRLLEILVDRAEADSLALTPPRITTVGQLPELLYRAKRPFADDLVQQMAWAAALRNIDRSTLAAVVSQPPDNEDLDRWLALARLLQMLHRELASDGLDFDDVAARGESLSGFTEEGRWQGLARIRQAYLDTLDRLQLWDRQTARLFALEQRECRFSKPIVLVAAVDLNRSQRQMLDQVAEAVTALVYAPPEWADRFDEHGCLIPSAWQDVDLGIPDEAILDAANPIEQAALVVERIRQFVGRFRAEEITIGLADERVVASIVRGLDNWRLPNRYGPGQPLSTSGVFRLFQDLTAFASSGAYADFAQLVRHSDVEAWLMRNGVAPGWVEELDTYYNEHLPRLIDGEWLGEREAFPLLRAAYDRISRLAAALSGAPRPIPQWLPIIGRILVEVYGGYAFDLENQVDHRSWQACSAVQDALAELARVPQSLLPAVSAEDLLKVFLDRLATQRIAPAAADAAIEVVGWLELPLDDAPALIVTSFNEGFVPSSINADLFLPGGLRSALGLDDNARRYARDAYATATLLAPWRDTTFLVARRNQDDDPLAPSRLLFAAAPETVARRSLRFFDEPSTRCASDHRAGSVADSLPVSWFEVPRPVPLQEPTTRMSVTSFKSYLACPYRFYLRHVLRLERIDDEASELDGAQFGNLAHAVLESFGRSAARDEHDARAIEQELNRLLDELVQQRFGRRPGAALLVQIEQLRLRLKAMACWQANWMRKGWRIEHVEPSFAEQPGRLEVDGEPMLLTGRIDRIDVNAFTGERVILDYKTSDAGETPEKTHRKGSAWIDLQLPLYRHLVPRLGIEGPVKLGYLLLPKSITGVSESLADWGDDDLISADAAASQIVRMVRAQRFWPPTDPPPPFSEEFAAICQDGVFGKKRHEH